MTLSQKTVDKEVRAAIEPMLQGPQHERLEVNRNAYHHMLGSKFFEAAAHETYPVTRQKLRMVYKQFIVRLVANRLES